MKLPLVCLAAAALASPIYALEGQTGIHDPSTLGVCDGKFYVYGTGGANSGLMSNDGWTWTSGAQRGGGGSALAPDVIHIGDRFYVYYATQTRQPAAEIHLTTNKTLDPQSPDYRWEDGGIVASTDGVEDCNGIDPGAFLDPSTGRLWLTYGSYFGYIRLVELDPKTGKRLHPGDKPADLAVNCEASDMIYRDGWYYLLATHGSCCQGAASGYNIRMGRSKSVTGPFLDHDGLDMIKGGGKLFLSSESRLVGPGHFGLTDLGEGVQVFSSHWEADLDQNGNSVLSIRPLLWRDGWPSPGENAKAGNYRLESARTGTVLELTVEGVPLSGGRGGGGGARRGGGGGRGAAPAAGGAPRGAGGRASGGPAIPPQDVAQVSQNWPTGEIAPRMANFLDQAQQKWTLSAVPGAGGYLGAPYFKIAIAGTDRVLAATADGELNTLPAFTGGPEQLWRIQQLTDGSYRIMPKVVPGSTEPMALSAIGSSFATLSKFDPESDRQRWNLKGL